MTRPVLAKSRSNLNRTYTHPVTGETVPSVTTITGMKDKSGPLVGWAVKLTAAAGIQRIKEIVEAIKEDGPAAIPTILALYGTAKARSSAERDLKGARFEPIPGYSFTAAKLGDLVHDLIESHVTTGVDEFSTATIMELEKSGVGSELAKAEVWPWFEQFLAFERRWNPEWNLSEVTVWNRSLGYAGTLDLGGIIGGQQFLIDIKSGSNVYPEAAMQLHALAKGEFKLDKAGVEEPLERIDKMAVLHLRPEFWELHEVKNDASAFRAFQALLAYLKEDINHSHNWLGTRVSGTAKAA